ncbi:MAG: aminoacyl-tRNA deacylase [Stackebrandtia sp.]
MNSAAYPPAIRAMLREADGRGLDVEVRERPVADSLAEAAEILGLTPRDLAKTLVVKRGKDDFLFVVVPGDLAIAWPKLRAVVGVNRLSLPDADTALAATGYERGTITPIGSSTDWPVYVDELLAGRRVAMGAGAHGYSAFVHVDQLVTGYGAVLADIAA